MLLLAAPGCERLKDAIPGRASVELEDGSADLPEGATLHEVVLEGIPRGPLGDTLRAQAGDAVRFIAGDGFTHAITFELDRLDAAQRAFLETTGQLGSAPLVEEGAQWILALEGAPPGAYPFRCAAHDRPGVLLVRPAEP